MSRESPNRPDAPPTLASLTLLLLMLSTTNYGGAQSAAIYREVVRRRRWLSDAEFMEFRSLAQLAPGANSPNLAVLIGDRLFGRTGAAIAFAAATVPGVLILLVLGALSIRFESPIVRGALAGCAAASVGAMLANAIEMTAAFRTWRALVVVASVAGAVVWLRVPLVVTLLIFVPISLVLASRVHAPSLADDQSSR